MSAEPEVRAPLTIAAAQPRCVPYDVAANARAHATAVRSARARVVVFPEMSLTGYHFDAPPVAVDDPALVPLIEACAATGTLALAGAPVPSGEPPAAGTGAGYSAGAGEPVPAACADQGASARPVSIGLLAVDGSGVTVAYRKMWLGGGEGDHFRPGREPAVVEVDGRRLGLAVCKDTGVPDHAAATAALGIDAYVASVLERAEDAHVPAERARRIATAHDVWVVVASFAGGTGEGYDPSAGGSGVWCPDGEHATRAGPSPGDLARGAIG
jgi:predicted amidohydrolase